MKPLRSGDKVRIVATASAIDSNRFNSAPEMIRSWGLLPEVSDQVLMPFGYFAGDDNSRLSALQEAINDQECTAIFCARGGYGTTRILDQLDFSQFNLSPKWIIGFSDITALHLQINALGHSSIHGSMPVQYGDPDHSESVKRLRELLFSGQYSYSIPHYPDNRTGKATGELIGGNLALIADSLGTKTEVNSSGKILFLEDIGEDIYRIDRMLYQLRRAGKFDEISGLILGQFTDIRNTTPDFGYTLNELLIAHAPNDIPVAFGFPAGHEAPNYPLLFGVKHSLEVTANGTKLDSRNL